MHDILSILFCACFVFDEVFGLLLHIFFGDDLLSDDFLGDDFFPVEFGDTGRDEFSGVYCCDFFPVEFGDTGRDEFSGVCCDNSSIFLFDYIQSDYNNKIN